MTRRSAPADEIMTDLESRIFAGDLQEGARLPSERELAIRFHVSRPTVREALRRLAERQLIRIEPGRGSFVAGQTLAGAANILGPVYQRGQVTARDVVEARISLESEAAALAAHRATRAEVGGLGQTLARLTTTEDRIEMVRLDLAFHFAVVRAAHNPVIETMFASIAHLAVELMLRSVGDPATRHQSHPYHQVIYQAVAEGNDAAARQAIRDHLAVAVDTYGRDYERRLDTMAHRALERILGPGADLDSLLETILPAPSTRDLGGSPPGPSGERSHGGDDSGAVSDGEMR